VIETEVFTDLWAERGLSESSKKTLKDRLAKNPDRGDPIPGCGLLRKERMADPVRRKGARGGLRVIFSAFSDIAVVWLITVYGKDEQDDLPKDEVGRLCEAVKRLASEERHRLRSQRENR
jgi:mRNA-degrading endonuclease RelE of RelBE toxin-antitoxin system